jgi:hypothetical protein
VTARGYADGADDGGDALALAAVEEDEDEGFVVYPLQRYGRLPNGRTAIPITSPRAPGIARYSTRISTLGPHRKPIH